ncbi:MAG: pyruvate kinase [Saprospiraceae bacterium]|nr:pyruvate kinase [Saprospiraceae bacterium]
MIDIKAIKSSLELLEKNMVDEESKRTDLISSMLHPSNHISARNLIHYLSLRSMDIRELQDKLHNLGLSSLASSESHIKAQLKAINQRLGKKYTADQKEICDYECSQAIMRNKSLALFGQKEIDAHPSVMITLDSTFAEDYAVIKNLLLNGMNIARINCAHDDESVWASMINKIKKACQKTGKPCKIYMDLAGPKIRTELIGKGRKKGEAKVKVGKLIYLANSDEGLDPKDLIINPGEPELISFLKKDDRVYFDDGIVRGIVEKVKNNIAKVRITRVSSAKKVIKNDKGINFPDSEMDIAPLTDFDVSCLPFICENADIIGYSFVRYPSDLANLRKMMADNYDHPPHLVIKIETPQAVRHLPELLMEGMKDETVGVMIARGDLAVEIGFERMSEIQEEILWICEAAHVPVIWATQVLENLNKSGLATRSEITDAGHATQAECIMLNKGAHTIEVLEMLKDISQRQSEHRSKKRYTFRPLSIAKKFIDK